MPERAGKKTNFRTRNLGEFKPQPAVSKRRNSESIRRLLFDTIYYEFDRSCEKASLGFKRCVPKANRRGYHEKGLSADSLYKASNDIQLITFSQLDALACYYRVPIALLLMFTRLRSEFSISDRRKGLETSKIIAAIYASLKIMDRIALDESSSCRSPNQVFSHEELKNIVNAFDEHLRGSLM